MCPSAFSVTVLPRTSIRVGKPRAASSFLKGLHCLPCGGPGGVVYPFPHMADIYGLGVKAESKSGVKPRFKLFLYDTGK